MASKTDGFPSFYSESTRPFKVEGCRGGVRERRSRSQPSRGFQKRRAPPRVPGARRHSRAGLPTRSDAEPRRAAALAGSHLGKACSPSPALQRRPRATGSAPRAEAARGSAPTPGRPCGRASVPRSPVGQEAASRLGREAGAGRPGVDARTHQIWNLSSGPVAYCIFNLLLGMPPRLAEASLRTTADAATRRSSRSLILLETAAPAAVRPRLQPAQNLATNCSPLRRRAPPRSAREAGVRLRSRRPRPLWEGELTCFAVLIHHHLGCVQTLSGVQGREGEILLVRYKGGP